MTTAIPNAWTYDEDLKAYVHEDGRFAVVPKGEEVFELRRAAIDTESPEKELYLAEVPPGIQGTAEAMFREGENRNHALGLYVRLPSNWQSNQFDEFYPLDMSGPDRPAQYAARKVHTKDGTKLELLVSEDTDSNEHYRPLSPPMIGEADKIIKIAEDKSRPIDPQWEAVKNGIYYLHDSRQYAAQKISEEQYALLKTDAFEKDKEPQKPFRGSLKEVMQEGNRRAEVLARLESGQIAPPNFSAMKGVDGERLAVHNDGHFAIKILDAHHAELLVSKFNPASGVRAWESCTPQVTGTPLEMYADVQNRQKLMAQNAKGVTTEKKNAQKKEPVKNTGRGREL